MIRSIVLFFLTAFLTAHAAEQHNQLDPDFDKIPFEQWLTEKEQTHFHWKAGMSRAELSFHQRLMSQIQLVVDGKDLQSRRGPGDLVFLVQLTDASGARYQSHSKVELSKLDPNIKAAELEYNHRVFLLPGEYHLAVAILDTATGEHAVRQSRHHVDATENELLKRAWRDLPQVEFLDKSDSPDNWFLPGMRGRLQWAAAVKTPARINILLNVAPSGLEPDTWRTMTRGTGRYGAGSYGPGPNGTGPVREHNGTSAEMAALIPTIKALTQTGSQTVSENIALLDLSRRRTVFQQTDVTDVDWPRLKTSLGEATTAAIDVHSLSDRNRDAQYLVSEVRRMMRASESGCAVVVLTNPVAFEKGEDLEPISTEALPACHVFYIRYHMPIEVDYAMSAQNIGMRRGRVMGSAPTRTMPREAIDQLAATLKPLNPKVYDVSSADQITKAFVDIEKVLGAKE